MKARWRVLALAPLAALVVLLAAACELRHVELGAGVETGAAPVSTRPRATTGYGCGDWIVDDLNALRASTCEGRCEDAPATPWVLGDKLSIMAATAGRWAFCGDRLGPPDAVGIEFAPGCRLFFLRYDDAGVAVRGTEMEYQADYDIFDRQGDGARIDLHLRPGEKLTMSVEALRCPERVHLRSDDGKDIVLSRLDGHGGTGVPIK